MKNIQLPSSKSISNRVLLLAALSDKPVILENLLDSDDTKYMRQALEHFGVKFETISSSGLRVVPLKRNLSSSLCQSSLSETLFIGNAGTAARFLSCLSLLLGKGEAFTLTGNKYMEKRPQGDLFESLRSVGIGAECLKIEGSLPVRMSNDKDRISNGIHVSGKISSQFLSGLLLVAPRLKNGLRIKVKDTIPSWPYVKMTIEILKIWGASVEVSEDRKNFTITPGLKAPDKYIVPSDMSSASYPLAWSVLKKKKICITNFGSKTLQGDEGFLEIIKKVGGVVRRQGEKCYIDPPEKVLPIGNFNWESMPDVSMTGMILAACADGESRFTGLESLRVKECDRIVAMEQLKDFGVELEVDGDEVKIMGLSLDELKITNNKLRIKDNKSLNLELKTLNSFDDHRIAMSFGVLRAVLGFGSDYYNRSCFHISDLDCVAKTWPDFWINLADWEGELRAVSGIVLVKSSSDTLSQERSNKEYLIVKKPRKENAWQFPQGGVDEGESDLQAAKRELMEECGMNLKVKFRGERPVGEYKYFFPKDFTRHDKNIVGAKVRFFEAEYLDGKVEVDGKEIVEHKWVTADEMGDYFAPAYLEVVQNFL